MWRSVMSVKMHHLNKQAFFIYHSVLRNFKTTEIPRHFHLSSNAYVRKHSLKSSVNEVSNGAINKIEPSHDENASFDDYFGIESDAGAILIDDSGTAKLHTEVKDPSSSLSAEKFYVTSFGYLRKDSENKPIFHGQYDVAEDANENENPTAVSFIDESSEHMNINSFKEKNMKVITSNPAELNNTIFKKGEKDTVKILPAGKSLKHFEDKKLTFTKEAESTSTIDNYDTFNDVESSKSREAHSFIDRMYFSDTYDNADTKIKYSSLRAESDDINNSKSKIEKSYFSGTYSNTSELTSASLKDTVSKIDVSSSSKNVDVNNTNSYINNLYFPSNNDNTEAETIIGTTNEIRNERLKSSNNLYDTHHEIQNTKIKNIAKTTRNKVNFVYKQSDFKSMNSSVGTHELVTNREKPIMRNEKMVTTSTNELTMNKRKMEENITKHRQSTNNEAIFNNTTSETNGFETAQDFVKNIRQNSNNYSLLKDKKIANRETLDSKGFRILENQVLKLSYFTRDEILDMLTKSVIYSDEKLLVLNKPYNLVMHDSKTTKDPCLSTFLGDLAKELDRENPNPELHIIHRLDKETTGCLLLARNELAAQYLKSLFSQRKISKCYWIVTTNVPDPLEGIIDIPIAEGFIEKRSRMVLSPEIPSDINYSSHARRGKRAISHYKVIATSGSAALVEVRPETGIKHQIRVHFGFGLLCPILGDHKYSHLRKLAPQKLPSDMLQKLHVRQSKVRHIPIHIHARDIVIPEYDNGRNLFVSAPMPHHMSRNLQTLKFRKEK